MMSNEDIEKLAEAMAKETGMDKDVIGCGLTNLGRPFICPPLQMCKTRLICEHAVADVPYWIKQTTENGGYKYVRQ